jgi:cysteine-rich repeat protein
VSRAWVLPLWVSSVLGCSGTEHLSLLSGHGGSGAGGLGGAGGSSGAAPPGAECGDGVLDPNESCDDGNDVDGDGCDTNCRASFVLSGQIGFRSTPLDARVGESEDSERSVFFAEALAFALPSEVVFDVHLPGAARGFPAQRGVLGAGALVNSYYFHFDTEAQTAAWVEFGVVFPSEILAVIAADATLDLSDPVFAGSTLYPTGAALRGLDSNDTIELAADRRNLRAIVGVEESVDSFRVLTRPSPDGPVVTSGQVALAPAPVLVSAGAAEDSGIVRLFAERRDAALGADLAVDLWRPGSDVSGGLGSGSVAAGRRVDSYLLHFDPEDGSGAVELGGAVTFPYPIAGIAVQARTLDASDALGNAATLYPTGSDAGRGLESSGDALSIARDGKSVVFSFRASGGIDQVRILSVRPE